MMDWSMTMPGVNSLTLINFRLIMALPSEN